MIFSKESRERKRRLKEWVKALRSGKYPQAQHALRIKDYDRQEVIGFCCLGVASEIHPELHDPSNLGDEYDEIRVFYGLTLEDQSTLVEMNDGKNQKSFDEIADYIEKEIL